MARRVGRRKEPDRDKYRLKERSMTEEGVFNDRTMLNMRKFFSRGIVSELDFIISTGKEADVYVAEGGTEIKERYVALKIFRVENTGFVKRLDYIVGDPRFGKSRHDMYTITNIWCRKEYANLKLAYNIGIKVPKPYTFAGNILAFEFIGDENGSPAKRLKETKLENPEKVLSKILAYVKELHAIKLVHADLSEYNILMKGDEPYIIDMGQAVMLGHPKFKEYLKRDVINILYYFRKEYGIEKEPEDFLKELQ